MAGHDLGGEHLLPSSWSGASPFLMTDLFRHQSERVAPTHRVLTAEQSHSVLTKHRHLVS